MPKSLKSLETWWVILLFGGMLVGTAAVSFVLINGHSHEFNAPWEPPWGILESTYEFFLLLGTGLVLVPVLVTAASPRFPAETVRRGMQTAAVALLTGLATIAIDLSHPMRLTLNTPGSGFGEAVAETAGLFAILAALLAVGHFAIGRTSRKLGFLLGGLVFFIAMAADDQMSDILEILAGQSGSFNLFPFAGHACSALVLGAAGLAFVIGLPPLLRGVPIPTGDRQRIGLAGRLLAAGLTLTVVCHLATFAAAAGEAMPARQLAIQVLAAGPLAIHFWLLEIAAGLFAPLLLLVFRPSAPGAVLAAALLAAAGQFIMRFDLLIAAQLGSLQQADAIAPSLLHYTPCIPKTAVVIGAFSLFLLLWTVTEKPVESPFQPR